MAQIKYIVVSKTFYDTMQIIIGGATRKLAIEAWERYNSGDKWNSKYGGQRDFKIIRMALKTLK